MLRDAAGRTTAHGMQPLLRGRTGGATRRQRAAGQQPRRGACPPAHAACRGRAKSRRPQAVLQLVHNFPEREDHCVLLCVHFGDLASPYALSQPLSYQEHCQQQVLPSKMAASPSRVSFHPVSPLPLASGEAAGASAARGCSALAVGACAPCTTFPVNTSAPYIKGYSLPCSALHAKAAGLEVVG